MIESSISYIIDKCVVTLNLSRVFMRGIGFVPRIFICADFSGKEGRLAVCRKRGKLFINTRKDVLL